MTTCAVQVTGEKVQALMRMSQAEQTAEQAFEETGNLLDQVADLKDRVTQVCFGCQHWTSCLTDSYHATNTEGRNAFTDRSHNHDDISCVASSLLTFSHF